MSGERVARLIETFDWATTDLPPPARWPQSLRTALDIIGQAPLPMLLLWGPSLAQLYNDAFARLIGNRHPAAFAQPVQAFWPEVEAFTAPVYSAVLAGETRSFEEQLFELSLGQGLEQIFLDLTYSPVLDESRQVAGILVTAVEVNARRARTAALQQRSDDTAQQLQLALEAANGIGTFDWNIREDRFSADAYFAQLHGIDPARARDLPIGPYLDGIHPDDRGLVTQGLKAALHGSGEYSAEYRLGSADGPVRWVSTRGRSHRDHHGRPVRFLGAAVDITERKASEQALQELNETLEARVAERTRDLGALNQRLQAEMFERERAEEALRHAQKMEAVGQLTGGIAHDFNNMLTGIIGSLDLMQRYLKAGRSGEIGRFAEAAITSAKRAAALTHRLLAFSRRQPLERQRIDPNHLVHSLEDLLRRTKGERIELHLSLQPEPWALSSDPNQLESALLNLVINARDAMPEGGSLNIVTGHLTLHESRPDLPLEPGDYVTFSISDTGIGMPQAIRDRAFDPFFTTKPVGQGTGLGLSMVYGFARQSGGHVELASEPGQGTCVRLYLPRFVDPTEQPEPARSDVHDSAPRARPGQSVLVVEDDPAVLMLVLDVLDELGYRAHPATDARSALPLLESGLPLDLLIADVGLPGISGRQLAQAARAHRPQLKILLMTGYTDQGEAPPLDPGMDLVCKPFDMSQLAQHIHDILEHAPGNEA